MQSITALRVHAVPARRCNHDASVRLRTGPSIPSCGRKARRWRHRTVSGPQQRSRAQAPEHEMHVPDNPVTDAGSLDEPDGQSSTSEQHFSPSSDSPLAQGIKNLNRSARSRNGGRPRPVDPFLGVLEDPVGFYGDSKEALDDASTQRSAPRRARATVRSGKRSEVVHAAAAVTESPKEEDQASDEADTSANVIEPDAVFSPESDPSTHVLPPEFHFDTTGSSRNSYVEHDTRPSFMHEPSNAPEPASEPPIDPLDPDLIAKTIADSSIYEELYNEFGMGEVFPPDSDDEEDDKRWQEEAASEAATGTDMPNDEKRRRRSDILLELASASPQTLEQLIMKHHSDIDEPLLEQLYNRIQVAQRFEEGEDVVRGLMLLFQRLRNEAERKTSTPAMRLLDDLLVIMDSDETSSEAARLETAAERMDMAFDPNGAGGGIDIFAVAAALGEGATAAVDEVTPEFVPRPSFVAEVKSLLDGAEERTGLLQMQLDQREAAFKDGTAAHAYTPSEERTFREELKKFRNKFEYSLTSVRWCTSFLAYAEGKEVQDAGVPPEATARQR